MSSLLEEAEGTTKKSVSNKMTSILAFVVFVVLFSIDSDVKIKNQRTITVLPNGTNVDPTAHNVIEVHLNESTDILVIYDEDNKPLKVIHIPNTVMK